MLFGTGLAKTLVRIMVSSFQEKACEDVDYEVHSSSSLSDGEEGGSDEEGEEERKRQQAIMEKEKVRAS